MSPSDPADAQESLLVSPAERELVTRSMVVMCNLQGFHFTLATTGYSVHLEGDYQAPDKMHLIGLMNGMPVDYVRLAEVVHMQPSNLASLLAGTAQGISDLLHQQMLLDLLLSDLRQQLRPLDSMGYASVVQETVCNVQTKRFIGTVDTSKPPENGAGKTTLTFMAGSVTLWIEPGTGYVHKLTRHLNVTFSASHTVRLKSPADAAVTPFPHLITQPLRSWEVQELTLTFTRFNDPTIEVETLVPPAG